MLFKTQDLVGIKTNFRIVTIHDSDCVIYFRLGTIPERFCLDLLFNQGIDFSISDIPE